MGYIAKVQIFSKAEYVDNLENNPKIVWIYKDSRKMYKCLVYGSRK